MCTNSVTGSLSLLISSAALLFRYSTRRTDGKYSYYAENVKVCLLREIIRIEHYALVSLVFQITYLKNHSALQLANSTKFSLKHCIFI